MKIQQFWRPIIFILLSLLFLASSWIVKYSNLGPHPDEINHVDASSYFISQTLPARIDAPEIAKTRSCFGVSYLDQNEIVYLLAGKFSYIVNNLIENHYQQFRLFQLLLLVTTLLIGLILFKEPLIALAFCTPQAWYVFSYMNGDAFPLAFSIISALLLHRLFSKVNNPRFFHESLWSNFIPLGVTIGFVLCSKKNYAPWLLFCGLIFGLIFIYANNKEIRKRFISGILLSFFSAGVIFIPHKASDLYENGFNKDQKLAEITESHATLPFKRSTPLNESYLGLWLRDKGVPFSELFTKWNWHSISFYSFNGLYGPMNIVAPKKLYWVLGFFQLLILLSIFITKDRKQLIILGITTFCSAVLVAAALHRSWTFDFQAQGRYLFPILPMILFAALNTSGRNRVFIQYFTTICLLLSLCSLYFVAIPKLTPN